MFPRDHGKLGKPEYPLAQNNKFKPPVGHLCVDATLLLHPRGGGPIMAAMQDLIVLHDGGWGKTPCKTSCMNAPENGHLWKYQSLISRWLWFLKKCIVFFCFCVFFKLSCLFLIFLLRFAVLRQIRELAKGGHFCYFWDFPPREVLSNIWKICIDTLHISVVFTPFVYGASL